MHPFQFSTRSGVLMTEFPIVHGHLLGHQVPFCGGGYFRLLPLDATLFFFNRLPLPGVFYIHPRDLDPGLPPIDGLSHMQHFKVYHGLGKARAKLARLFNALEFGAIGDIYADRQFEYRELYA
jgi:hypothetical protein